MNNCPAFGYVLARGLMRDRATDHMVKEPLDIYKTPQSLSFLFGSTLSLSDLLGVLRKHPVLHTNYEVYMCIHMSVCICISMQSWRERHWRCSCPLWWHGKITGKYCVIIISQHPPHRSEFTWCLIGGTEKMPCGADHKSAQCGQIWWQRFNGCKGHPEPQILATVIKYPLGH